MFQGYSNNITVGTGTTVPINVTTIQKGVTTTHPSASTIQLNKCGVYMVSVNGYGAESTTAGNIGLQLYRDGVAIPEAITLSSSTTTTDLEAVEFTTLVQVRNSNSCKCCDSGVDLTIVNIGVPTVWSHVNVVVTKVC